MIRSRTGGGRIEHGRRPRSAYSHHRTDRLPGGRQDHGAQPAGTRPGFCQYGTGYQRARQDRGRSSSGPRCRPIQLRGEPLPLVIHGVHDMLYPVGTLDAWPDELPHSRLVFIVDQVDGQELEADIRRLLA
nr:GTP-binding protein [Chitinimonas koreensis]